MKRVYVTWQDVEAYCQDILRQIHLDGWVPDYIVGITRGGLTPANLISQYLEIPMHALKISLRDNAYTESAVWMSEDAYAGKKILIVDDINDSGATINWIRQDWQNCCKSQSPLWADIWSNNVRFAVLVDNQSSDNEIPITYTSQEVNKIDDPQWIVFPWEDWWI